MVRSGVETRDQAELDRLLERLSEPQTAAALHLLLDNIELLAVIVSGIDGLARKGEVIGDTVAEVLDEVRAASRSTGLDARTTTHQLATVIPTLAEAAPAMRRVLASPIVAPEPIAVLSEAAEALVKGLQAARTNDTRIGLRKLLRVTRDEDVQRGLGFAIEVTKVFGRDLATKTLIDG